MADAKVERHSDGPSAAALLAAGIGATALGIFVVAASASASINDALRLSEPVGPLSGKTTFAVVVWLIAWGALYGMWRNKEVNFGQIFMISLILVAVGFLFTFPPFFELFAAEE